MTETRDPRIADDDTLVRRAFAAYYRAGTREGYEPQQLDIPAHTSHVAEHNGKHYVILENINGVLAVYRVRNDGILKQLRRWPAAIENY